jgi:hypothetical protein
MFTLEQAAKAQRGSIGILLLLLQSRRCMGWVLVFIVSYRIVPNTQRIGVGGQPHAPAALPPGKTRCLLCRRLGGPQFRSGRVRKISPTPGFDPRTVQPVASRYTDWTIPCHSDNYGIHKITFRGWHLEFWNVRSSGMYRNHQALNG